MYCTGGGRETVRKKLDYDERIGNGIVRSDDVI